MKSNGSCQSLDSVSALAIALFAFESLSNPELRLQSPLPHPSPSIGKIQICNAKKSKIKPINNNASTANLSLNNHDI